MKLYRRNLTLYVFVTALCIPLLGTGCRRLQDPSFARAINAQVESNPFIKKLESVRPQERIAFVKSHASDASRILMAHDIPTITRYRELMAEAKVK